MTVLHHADGSITDWTPRKSPPQPYHVRREYAKPNFKQRPLYLACRLWVAMLRMGLA